jgi:hypothetical protein
MPGRKPTALLEVGGAFKANPARARKSEPDSGRGIGPAPDYLTEAQQKIWDEIVSDCAPGVFRSSDRAMLRGLVILESQFREDPAGFGGRQWMTWRSLLAACGMTPADRSRVSVEPRESEEKPKSGLASFL